jgi:5-(carboxyamino)imidazole ribonucleotide synthase
MRIGILGGGQLGRMLAWAGIPLGHQFRFLDPDPEAPAQAVGTVLHGPFDDTDVLRRFAEGLDVITYEFENVPVETAAFLSELCRVDPPPLALKVSQDRLTEKEFARQLGIATPDFAPVRSWEELRQALSLFGFPNILKTRRFGYDGRGQWLIRRPSDARQAWQTLGHAPLILEAFVPFDRELSLISVRSRSGVIRCYPLVENRHEGGILRQSFAPADRVTPELQCQAEKAAHAILNEVLYVGVLAIEFFEVKGRLLFNEMAPRVHNSGHWTIEGAVTSQFENHLRAITDWPLGDTTCRGFSAMWNIIGSVPDPDAIVEIPGAHWHVYGKAPRAGRKLGHVTIGADSLQQLHERWNQLLARIGST